MQKQSRKQTAHATASGPGRQERVEVTFALEDAEAKEVFLSGEFNEWSPRGLPMIRREGNRWEKRLMLPEGRYEYKFVVDGAWMADPSVRQASANAFGSTNSVAWVGEEVAAKAAYSGAKVTRSGSTHLPSGVKGA